MGNVWLSTELYEMLRDSSRRIYPSKHHTEPKRHLEIIQMVISLLPDLLADTLGCIFPSGLVKLTFVLFYDEFNLCLFLSTDLLNHLWIQSNWWCGLNKIRGLFWILVGIACILLSARWLRVMYQEAKKLVKLLNFISTLAFNKVFSAISKQGCVFHSKP